jgi:hypothetical protein
MLTPLPVTTSWQTSAAGLYYRWKSTDYILISPMAWKDYDRRFAGDNYLTSQNVNEIVTTAYTFPKNRPFFLSWYAFNSGNSNFVQMDCYLGYGSDTSVQLRFWSNGKVDIYKNLTLLGNGDITDNVKYPVRYGPNSTVYVQPGKQPAPQYMEVMIIPCRNRELLVVSNQSGGFVWRFDDLDENDTDATITGEGSFRWHVPEGQASVQFAPLNFLTSGTLLTTPYRERFAPASGAAHIERAFYNLPGYGTSSVTARLRNSTDTGDFTPDGSSVDVRGRVDMAGDGTSTPFVYGMESVFSTVTANTDGLHSTVIDNYLTDAELIIPEEETGEVLTLKVKTPDALETAGVTAIKRIENRPFEARVGSILIFGGRTNPPKFKDGISDYARDVRWEVRSRTKAHELYKFQEVTPFDYLYLDEAIKLIAKLPGYTDADMDIPAIDFQIPGVGAASEGEWANIPEVGDSAQSWLDKLHETYARNYWRGWVPTATRLVYRFKSEASLGTSPVAILYDSMQNAHVHGLYDLADYSHWYSDFEEEPLELEANVIRVIGNDPRTNLPIFANYVNASSIAPDTLVSARPDDWIGEPRPYAYFNPAITTLAAAFRCLGTLVSRVPVKHYVATWTCQMMFKTDGSPVWKGDPVQLYNKGVYRINTIRVPFSLETGNLVWRKATYTGRKIPGSPTT